MRYYLFALLSAFSLGITDIFFWPMLPLAFAILREVEGKKVYALAFTTGIIVDLLWGQFLGVSSSILLLYTLLIFFFIQKFKSHLRIVIAVTIFMEVVSFILQRAGIMHF